MSKFIADFSEDFTVDVLDQRFGGVTKNSFKVDGKTGKVFFYGSKTAYVSQVVDVTANGVIPQYCLIKASTVPNTYEIVNTTDSPALILGWAVTGAPGVGATFTADFTQGGEAILLNDGFSIINPGDLIIPSPSIAGHVRTGNSSIIGSAVTFSPSTVGFQVKVR